MKKILTFMALVLFCIPMLSAGIITKTNQSAMYIRMLARNASRDIDAVYYNPAGLTQLANGFHVAIYNQTISQEKKVINTYPLLNQEEYIGEVNVPFFPNFYAVYKKDKLALSFGFGPNAGGGTADFAAGLPSFEIPFTGLPFLLTSMGVPTTKYSADLSFKGSSIFYGFQVNGSYAISDIISVAAGVRYINAVNTYEGSINNIMINPGHPLINPTGAMLPAEDFFNLIGQPAYAAMVSNKAVDVKQTATGITPLLSLNIRPNDNLNIGIKYEFNTKLELVNETTADNIGIFPDGQKTHKDIPAILSFGLEYAVLPELRASISANYFFDKNADWDGAEEFVDSNTYDLAFGFEYDLTETILLSAGYMRTQLSLSEEYQSDLSHELTSDTFGFGGRISVGENFDLDLGGLYTSYLEAEKSFTDPLVGSYLEKYQRSNWAFTVGLGYHF